MIYLLINLIMKKKKREIITKWQNKADIVFSKFIRTRDAFDGGYCITCKEFKKYEEMDAGHFMPRSCKQLRYDERNVNAQCRRCNRFEGGHQYIHGQAIDYKFGEGTADTLKEIYLLSKKEIQRFDYTFYEEVYKHYLGKIR